MEHTATRLSLAEKPRRQHVSSASIHCLCHRFVAGATLDTLTSHCGIKGAQRLREEQAPASPNENLVCPVLR